jgi:hypothetical protein
MYPRSLRTAAMTAGFAHAALRLLPIVDRRVVAGARGTSRSPGRWFEPRAQRQRLPASAAGAACGCRSLPRAAARVTSP